MGSEERTPEQCWMDFQKKSQLSDSNLKSLKSVAEIQAHYRLFTRTSDKTVSLMD